MDGIEKFRLQQGKVALKGKLDTKEETLDNRLLGSIQHARIYALKLCLYHFNGSSPSSLEAVGSND